MKSPQCLWDARAQLGEGVFWHPQENAVYWVDILASRLYRMSADGSQQTWAFPGTLSAALPCATGDLVATFRDGVYRLDLTDGTRTRLCALETELPGNRFNDATLDTQGHLWFGSMDDGERHETGRFYRWRQGARPQRLDQLGRFCITNGPAFSLDGRRIYFTDSVNRRIFSAPLDGQGNPGAVEEYARFAARDGHPDGMCSDTEGGLWVCHFGGSRVSRLSAQGEVTAVIELPAPNVTKCAFGGPDYSTLYVTTARKGLDEAELARFPLCGGLFAVEVDWQGAPLPLFTAPGD